MCFRSSFFDKGGLQCLRYAWLFVYGQGRECGHFQDRPQNRRKPEEAMMKKNNGDAILTSF